MWLPVLTGRTVSLPALSTWVERPVDKDFFEQARRLAAYTQPLDDPAKLDRSTQAILDDRGVIPRPRDLSQPETLDLMRQLRITHVYVAAKSGRSNPRIDVEVLRRDPRHYEQVYSQDGVAIFEVHY
jgi:hypothetical protein